MNDSRREEAVSREIESAASKLTEALLEVRDAVFGYPSGALDIANEELRRAGVKLVSNKRQKSASITPPDAAVSRSRSTRSALDR